MREDAILIRYLILAFLSLGILTSLMIPPFQVPDEPAHWVKGVSFLHPDGTMCGKDVALVDHFRASDVKHHPDVKIEKGLYSRISGLKSSCADSTATYASQFSYPFILIGKSIVWLVGGSALTEFQMSRVVGGLFIITPLWLLALWGSGNDGAKQLDFVFISSLIFLSPIGLQQTFSINADVVTNSFSILIGGLLLCKGTWQLWQWLVFAIIGFSALMTKPILAPVVLGLPFLVGRKQAMSAFFICYIQVFCAFLLMRPISVISSSVDAPNQWQYILSSPISVGWILLRDSIGELMRCGSWLFELGWLDHISGPRTKLLYLLMSGCGMVLWWSVNVPDPHDVECRESNFYRHLVFLLSWLVSCLLVSLALYVAWSPVGSQQVDGLQGRYFIPHILVLMAYILRCTRPFFISAELRTPRLRRVYSTSFLIFFVLYSIFKTLDTLERYW